VIWLRAFRRFWGHDATTGWLACADTADAFALRTSFRRAGWRVRIRYD
jgi:hypothetical protein